MKCENRCWHNARYHIKIDEKCKVVSLLLKDNWLSDIIFIHRNTRSPIVWFHQKNYVNHGCIVLNLIEHYFVVIFCNPKEKKQETKINPNCIRWINRVILEILRFLFISGIHTYSIFNTHINRIFIFRVIWDVIFFSSSCNAYIRSLYWLLFLIFCFCWYWI